VPFLKSDLAQFYGEQGAEGEIQVGPPKQRRAKKKVSNLAMGFNIEEIKGLSMPPATENKLVRLFIHWTNKFCALNKEIDQALEESRDSRERIEKNMQERSKILEPGLNH
jgi:hypothetical protein